MQAPGWVGEFKAFLLRGSVVDLAVGLVVGAAFTAIVGSAVEDLLNPLIGLATGGVDFTNHFTVLAGERKETLAATRQAGAAVLAWGNFINAVIKFLIVGFAVFWVVKALSKLKLREMGKAAAAPAGPTPSEALLAEIRDELRAQRKA
jgi:large conductance mechanosensitive channel